MNTKRVSFAETASVLAYEVEGKLRASSYRRPSTPKLPVISENLPVMRPAALLVQGSLKSALRVPTAVRPQAETVKKTQFYLA